MIGFLQGQILSIVEGKAVLGIGSAELGWTGYQLAIPANIEYTELKTGQKKAFYIHTHVREDALDLYGFLTEDERQIFLTLTSVSGIGPKTGMAILSVCRAAELCRALALGDRDFLNELPGVGKKTAERLIVELKDKLAAWATVEAPGVLTGVAVAKSGSKKSPLFEEARVALGGLGFKDPEVQNLLNRVFEENPGVDRIETVIKLALRKPPKGDAQRESIAN